MAHRPAVYKDSTPPSMDSWFFWSLGAQRISQEDTGIWQAVGRILCSEHSTQPGGQARGDSQAGSWNPFWQLAFSFLFTCCINSLAIAFWGSWRNLWWCNKTQVSCRFEYVDGFALGCFTLRKIQKLPQRQETNPEPTQWDLLTCQQRAASEACSAAAANMLSLLTVFPTLG